MATSWLKPLHIGKGRSVSTAIQDILDYVDNPEKTDNGKLITGYQCDTRVADEEFVLAKRQYEHITGRGQSKKRDVIAYHVRQSFKPGEITPEEANRLGVELAERFTKGNHAFVVCTHTDKNHVHNHVIFNSTALDCTRKFRNFWGSSKALRRLNDLISIEHGLSVIENPQPRNKKEHYGAWLGENKKPSFTAQIKQAIDKVLQQAPPDFDAFLLMMEQADIRHQRRGKKLAFFAPGQKKAIRCDTLGGQYTERAIRERIEGVRTVSSSGGEALEPRAEKINLLIDIQAKLQDGKGTGYAKWAQGFNLKEMAKTLNFLIEHQLTDYAVLEKKAAAATARFNDLSAQIKQVEARLADIAALQKNISTYSRTREVYKQYREAGYSKKFREEHEGDILLHQSAKKAFDALGVKKLPGIKDLKAEYAALAAEKKKLYQGYRQAKEDMCALVTAKHNTDRILGTAQGGRDRDDLQR